MSIQAETFSVPTLKVLLNGQQKRATCLATLLQNELNSDVVRFTTHVQTFVATNQGVASCEKLTPAF